MSENGEGTKLPEWWPTEESLEWTAQAAGRMMEKMVDEWSDQDEVDVLTEIEEIHRYTNEQMVVAIEAFRVATKRSHKKRAMIAWAGAAGIRAASALLAAAIMVDICGGGRESMEQIEKQAAFRVLKGGKP